MSASNEKDLYIYESKSIVFIHDVMEKNPGVMPIISYSGGKDNLVTHLLTLRGGLKLPMILVNTDLEFPETIENVSLVSEKYGLPLIVESGEARFWDVFVVNGSPVVSFRWRCRSCKIAPVKALIEKTRVDFLSFVGQRKFEPAKRMQNPRV